MGPVAHRGGLGLGELDPDRGADEVLEPDAAVAGGGSYSADVEAGSGEEGGVVAVEFEHVAVYAGAYFEDGRVGEEGL